MTGNSFQKCWKCVFSHIKELKSSAVNIQSMWVHACQMGDDERVQPGNYMVLVMWQRTMWRFYTSDTLINTHVWASVLQNSKWFLTVWSVMFWWLSSQTRLVRTFQAQFFVSTKRQNVRVWAKWIPGHWWRLQYPSACCYTALSASKTGYTWLWS